MEYIVGMEVEVYGLGRWYPGRIVKVGTQRKGPQCVTCMWWTCHGTNRKPDKAFVLRKVRHATDGTSAARKTAWAGNEWRPL